MSHINDSVSSTKQDNIEGYRLIIPENLVKFKEVYSVVLKRKEVEIEVEEVGDALNFSSINKINTFDIIANIESNEKLLYKANVVANIARNIRAICDDDKLHNAVHILKKIVQILINYRGIEGSIYFFDEVKGYLREASLVDICSSSFIEKLEISLSEVESKNGAEVVLVNSRVKEVVIEKICDRRGIYRAWLEDLIYPLKEEVLVRIRKCDKGGIRYNYESKEMYSEIANRYVTSMLRKRDNGEYNEGFGKQLPSRGVFCGTEKTAYKAMRVIGTILKPIVVDAGKIIFPWLELIDYIVKEADKVGGRILSQEYLSKLVGELYKEFKFCNKYRRYYKEKEITEEISERKRGEIVRFLSTDA